MLLSSPSPFFNMSHWTPINTMISSRGSSSSPSPTRKTNGCRIIDAISLEEALLIEFDTESESGNSDTPTTDKKTDVRVRTQAVFAQVSDPANEASTSTTPLLSKISVGKRVKPGPQPAVVPTTYKPTDKHARLPSDHPVDSAVKIVTNGRNMLAFFGDETVPRTKNRILVEDHDGHGNGAIAVLDARLSIPQIFAEYPMFIRGSLLRVFSCEGYYPELIWKNLPSKTRQISEGDCPWAWLDEALDREMELMVVAESEEPTKAGKEAQVEIQSDSSAAAKKRGAKKADWSLTDDAKLILFRDHQSKSYKEVAEALGRTISACQSRYSKLRKQREAATTAAATERTISQDVQAFGPAAPGDDNADNAMVVNETEPLPGGQNDDPMVLDSVATDSG